MVSRREMLVRGAAAFASGAIAASVSRAEVPRAGVEPEGSSRADRSTRSPRTRVVTPNGRSLPSTVVDGVRVFHLIAMKIRHEVAPGLTIDCWGYNGSTPGPTIELYEGEPSRFYVTNELDEPTTVHWHGVVVPNGMDGVAGLTQRPIPPGETFRYEFTPKRGGTFMYHPHFDEMVQMGLGMMGMLIVHPKSDERPVDRDYALMLSEWFIKPGTSRPDPTVMNEFNVLTINSRAFPGTSPLVAKVGDRVRIRIGNLSAMDHHPIHLHGVEFRVTETDGGRIPEAGQWPETTVLVPVGTTRTIELIAEEPGDWALHCHMTHHVMNQMGHGLPNVLGMNAGGLDERIGKLLPGHMTMGTAGMGDMASMDMGAPPNSIPMRGGKGPFGTIDMGGMFTILKVRSDLAGDGDPGWYAHPDGTVAGPATEQELARDLGEKAPRRSKRKRPRGGSGHHHHHG